jgi:hypothetical protein
MKTPNIKNKIVLNKKNSMKIITDENGIKYKEASYSEYLQATNKHRIIKTLEAQYFVEVKKNNEN